MNKKYCKKKKRYGWHLVAAALSPIAVASAYLFLTRSPSYSFTAFSDYAALGVSVLVGAVFIGILPIRAYQRIFSLIIYVPSVAVLLFFYTFWFIAVVFHDGL